MEIPHGVATIAVALQLMNFQPVTEMAPIQMSLRQGTSMGAQFKPRYKVSDGRLIEISAGLTAELETIGSLIEIGNVLFKDSRDITQNEAAIMQTYFKRKYRKA